MFPIIVASLDSTDSKHGVQWQVRHCRRRRNFIYIKYFRKAAGILLLGVWCKNIRYNIPIITPRKVRPPWGKTSGDLNFLWETNRQDVSIEDCCVWANCLRTNWWQSDWSLHLGRFAVAIINGLQCLSHRWLVIYPQCYYIFPLLFFTIYTVIWSLSHILRLVSDVEQGLNTLLEHLGHFI